MRSVLQALCTRVRQPYADGPDAALRLQFYEALAALLQREGAADAAALFARAALSQVRLVRPCSLCEACFEHGLVIQDAVDSLRCRRPGWCCLYVAGVVAFACSCACRNGERTQSFPRLQILRPPACSS